jgi:hypothetical protein
LKNKVTNKNRRAKRRKKRGYLVVLRVFFVSQKKIYVQCANVKMEKIYNVYRRGEFLQKNKEKGCFLDKSVKNLTKGHFFIIITNENS